MMSFSFGDFTHLVRESERIDEILEFEHALESLDIFALDDLPLGHLRLVLRDLCIRDRRLAAATRDTL
jgi:hypothetical protein